MNIQIKVDFLKHSATPSTVLIKQEDMADPSGLLHALSDRLAHKMTAEEHQNLSRVCRILGEYLDG